MPEPPSASSPFHRALIDLCYERGFEQLTPAELCERAGLPRAAFEQRYSSLEQCFADTLEACAEEFLATMDRAYREGGPRWQDRLRAAAYAALLHMQEDPVRAHFTVVESALAGEGAQLVLERVLLSLSRFLDQGRALPSAASSLSGETAASLNGSLAMQIRLAIERVEADRFAEFVPQLMYAAVLPYLSAEEAAEELEYLPPVPIAYRPGAEIPPPLPPRKISARRSARPLDSRLP